MNHNYIYISDNQNRTNIHDKLIIQKIIISLFFLSSLIFMLIGLEYSKSCDNYNFENCIKAQNFYLIAFILFNIFMTSLFAFIRVEYCCENLDSL